MISKHCEGGHTLPNNAHNLVRSKKETVKTIFNAKTKSMTDADYAEYLSAMPPNDVLAISWHKERARTDSHSNNQRTRHGSKGK